MTMRERSRGAALVHQLATREGFVLCGITEPQPSTHAAFVRQWIASEKHGDMDYMAQHLDKRIDITQLVHGAKSVIVLALNYPGRQRSAPPGHTQVAAYAQVRDYHTAMKKKMHRIADELRGIWPNQTFRSYVDTGPVLEREQALRAGLGWIGKNTMLIHPRLGSYVLLGVIVTTVRLQTEIEAGALPVTDHCGTCTRCLQACPTQCLTPYALDATRCISYLTIEYQGTIDPSLHAAQGSWIAGCDVCQQVCPFNQDDAAVTQAAPRPSEVESDWPVQQVLAWTPAERQRAVRNSALKRIKLPMFRRNAVIVAGNVIRQQPASELAKELRTQLHRIAGDSQEEPLVQQTAQAVCEQ